MAKKKEQPSKNEHARGKGAQTQHINFKQLIWRYLHSHVQAFKLSFRNLSMTPIASLLTMTAIGLCLSLPAGLYLFIKNMQQFNQGWDENAAISLYINAKSTPSQIEHILAKINEYPYVQKITHLSPDNALQEFKDASGLSDMLALLPENPLPRVISIQIDTKKTNRENLLAMKTTLAKLPQVKQASFDFEWVEKLNTFIMFGKILTTCLYIIIGLGVILMIGNTIRLALEKHKDEIQVLNLIGATLAFIRRPFLYRGFLYGGLGGVIAVLIINTLTHILQKPSEELASLFHGVFFLENLRFYDTVLLLAASAGLGWLGAAIAFTQQNRAVTPEGA